MNAIITNCLKKNFLIIIVAVAFAAGLSIVSSPAARADGGNEKVMVNGKSYTVEHDGGPFIEWNDMKLSIQGHDDNRFVVMNGKTFKVTSEEDHHENNHHNDHNDHKDHKDHKDQQKDHHGHHDDHKD